MEIVTKVYKWVHIIYQVLGTRNNKIHNKQIVVGYHRCWTMSTSMSRSEQLSRNEQGGVSEE